MNLDELKAVIGNSRRLAEIVRTVRSRIENHRSTYSGNESQTRTSLINPVLTELGWDVTDPEIVLTEYPMQGGKIDYALMHEGGSLVAVEAKNLGTDISADVTAQLLNYIADNATVRYAVATNGDAWRMQIRGERKLAVDLKLTAGSDLQAALELLCISRSVLAPEEKHVAISDPEVSTKSPDAAVGSRTAVQTQRRLESGWMLLSHVRGLDKHRSKPTRIRLPDGNVRQIHSGIDVLRVVARWLVDTGRLTPQNAQLHYVEGNTRYFCNHEPLHPRGNEFRKPMQIGTSGVFIEENMGIQLSVDSSCVLLKHCGVDPNTVQVRFG